VGHGQIQAKESYFSSRSTWRQSTGPTKLPGGNSAKAAIHGAKIIAARVLGRSEYHQPRDHSARKLRSGKWANGYIRSGTVVRWVREVSYDCMGSVEVNSLTRSVMSVQRNRFLPALKAPPDSSPGQRPGYRGKTTVLRPEGAQEPSALSGRKIILDMIPGAPPRAGFLRAVGATW